LKNNKVEKNKEFEIKTKYKPLSLYSFSKFEKICGKLNTSCGENTICFSRLVYLFSKIKNCLIETKNLENSM
jgi:hypothetical protein